MFKIRKTSNFNGNDNIDNGILYHIIRRMFAEPDFIQGLIGSIIREAHIQIFIYSVGDGHFSIIDNQQNFQATMIEPYRLVYIHE